MKNNRFNYSVSYFVLCFFLFLGMFCVIITGAFAQSQEPQSKYVKPDPEIEKPDYSGLSATEIDPQFEETLEKLREEYNRIRLMDSRRYPWRFPHADFETAAFGPKTIAGDLAFFLQKAGLEAESQKILDLFADDDKLMYFQYTMKEYVQNEIPFQNLRRTQRTLEFLRDHTDLWNNINHVQHQLPQNGLYLLYENPWHDDAQKFTHYADWVKAYVTRNEPDVEEIRQRIKKAREQLRNDSQLDGVGYRDYDSIFAMAILLHYIGHEKDAEDAAAFAHEIMESTEKHIAQRNGKALPEPIVPSDVAYWQSLIRYRLRTGNHEMALETLGAMKKAYIGKGVSQTQAWNNELASIAFYLCSNGRFEQGMELMNDYIDRETGRQESYNLKRAYENLALMLAQKGLKKESQLVMQHPQFPQGNEPSVRYCSARYVVHTGTPEQGLAALRELLETSLDGTYYGIPEELEEINELGIFLLKYGDIEGASVPLGIRNQKISGSVNAGRYQYPFLEQHAGLLAEGYRYGYKKQTVDFITKLKDPAQRVLFLCFMLDQLPEIDETEKTPLLDIAYETALQVAPNPGYSQVQEEWSQIKPTRNDLLKSVASSSLIAGNLPLAQKASQEFEELDATLPNGGRVEPDTQRGHLLSRDEQLWLACYRKIIRSPNPNLPAAILAADRLVQPKARYDAFKRIVAEMLYENE